MTQETRTHTPGPWALDKDLRRVYAEDQVVADVLGLDNARLIAAAPDLLEAAQDVHDSWERMVPAAEFEADLANLLAAIRKATDQQ